MEQNDNIELCICKRCHAVTEQRVLFSITTVTSYIDRATGREIFTTGKKIKRTMLCRCTVCGKKNRIKEKGEVTGDENNQEAIAAD